MLKFYSIFLILFCFSCKYISDKEEKYVLAKAGGEVLYQDDVLSTIPNITHNADSALLMKEYVDNWVRKKLMEKEIFDNTDFDEESVRKQLDELKYQLALHQYRVNYINQKLDTNISSSVLKEYYDGHKDDFQLRNTIVKGVYAKIPVDAPHIEEINSMILSEDIETKEEFKTYCYQFSIRYHLNDSIWIPFEELLEATPFEKRVTGELQFLRKNKGLLVESDSLNKYFLKIHEYKLDNEISPFEFVRERIKSILINKHKIELIGKIEKEIYSRAVENKEFSVFY